MMMASPCDPHNCSTICYSYPYCIPLTPLPPLHPFPPIQPNDGFYNNSNSNNQQAEIVIAALSTTVFILTVLSIIRCSRDSGARHDEPLHHPPSTLAPSTITTIQTTNPNNNSDHDNGDTTHHVWLIRTVGLDDRIIKSIASSVYNGTNGHGSIECCSVCLGEFFDGEEIKLLQGCCHLFHALCIDTWLKSHVNCPLCRRPVIDGSDHSEPKQEDSVITIDSVSEFGSSSSRSMDNDDDMIPSRISGSFDGLFSLELCDATNIFLPSKLLAGQEREHIC